MEVESGRRRPVCRAKSGSCPCERQRSSAAQGGGYRLTLRCPFLNRLRGLRRQDISIASLPPERPAFQHKKNRLAFQTRDNNARHDLTISVTYKILWAPSSGLHFFRGSARLTLCAAIDNPKLRRPHQDQTEPATTAANQQVRRWNEVHDRQSVVGKRVQKSPQSLINEARFWRRSPRW
jgi:hypothetical protein